MSHYVNHFAKSPERNIVDLSASDDFEKSRHCWSREERDALALAHAARRPLLVRGEPGSGKSQLARAAAQEMKAGPPLLQVIHPRFEPRDLLYRYDTIRRLADANSSEGIGDEARYVKPGVLWRAWEKAAEGVPVVVLLDEIDKGDADVPNSLLEVLGQRSFRVEEVPDLDPPSLPGDAMPLIVITTNEERELPAAFVRRCVVLNLNPPIDDEGLLSWLRRRVDAHSQIVDAIAPAVIERALRQVLADRRESVRQGYPKVGLAEALDLLTALAQITADCVEEQREAMQSDWLERISAYALVKHAGTDPGQSRVPVSAAQGENN